MKKDIRIYLFLIMLIVLCETTAQYHLKKSKLLNSYLCLLVGILLYAVICLLLLQCYKYKDMGITNFVWSIISIISILITGYLVFGEKITKYDMMGLILCIVGLYFIFIKDH